MAISEKDHIEVIKSEMEDDYSDDSLFNISSWGADLSFRELVSMYNDNELVKPELQRKYVWDKIEATRSSCSQYFSRSIRESKTYC